VRSPRRRLRVGLMAITAALLTTGCVEHVTQSPVDEGPIPQDFIVEPIGRYAVDVDQLWTIVFWIAVAVFILVWGLLLAAILRFRQRPDDEGILPKQIHGNPRLEALWTVIPAVILAVIAVPTVRTIFTLADTPDIDFEAPNPDEEALLVSVTGHQFWWEYEYPQYADEENALVTANVMYIPVGREVVLEMTSSDVIHSFWIPKLNGKQDVVPGYNNRLKLHTDEPGEYLGQCAEFCGLSHANMRARVIAVPEDEFESWAEAQAQPIEDPTDDAALEGQDLFQQYCVACHQVRGFAEGARIGPDLTYFADREWFAGAIFRNDIDEDAQLIHDWLEDPPAMKPMQPGIGIGMPDLGLQEDEIEALIEYMRTLRSDDQA
jgi:cytochrome c oxidase subunit II